MKCSWSFLCARPLQQTIIILGVWIVLNLLLSKTSVLSEEDKIFSLQTQPEPSQISAGLRAKIDWCHPLGFLANPRVALASFPGSGNTWLRYLIQQSTGILTGSVYLDEDLLKNGFPAESITNGSVIVVKTHKFSDAAISKFDRAILLVRDPFASIPAEFNRKFAGHTGHASVGHYHRNGGWRSFVKQRAAKWRKMNLAWLEAYNDKPEGLIVITYEDLTLNLEKQLSKLLNFLGVKVPEGSMRCVIEHKEGIYKRAKQQALNFTIFDQELIHAITVEKDIVYRKLELAPPPVPSYIVSSD